MNSHKILIHFIALVWLVNGLFCKVLNLVSRHQEIVARILNADYARELTLVIGLGETLMAIWVWTGIKRRLNAIVQIGLVLTMNVIEYILVPDLLLWGRWNALFAVLFAGVVCYVLIYGNKES